MSTRSQIRFVDGRRISQVYRHSDGYPRSVIAALCDLQRLLGKTQTYRGGDYAAAQFIFREKLKTAISLYGKKLKTLKDLLEDTADQPYYLLGHGVEDPANGIHGDEEYLYIVNLVESGDWKTEGDISNWEVKISDHCGWNYNDPKTAFESAKWIFEGGLAEAYTKFVTEEDK